MWIERESASSCKFLNACIRTSTQTHSQICLIQIQLMGLIYEEDPTNNKEQKRYIEKGKEKETHIYFVCSTQWCWW